MAGPSLGWLKLSEAKWKRAHTYRTKKLAHWRTERSRAYHEWRHLVATQPEGSPERVAAYTAYEDATGYVKKWTALRDEASYWLKHRRQQILDRGGSPTIITAAEMGLRFDNRFGSLGPEHFVTGHHTAGPTDENIEHAKRLCYSYHLGHAAKGWAGIGYHFCIARDGTILGLRPTHLKGAHVGGHNTSNLGVMFHGTTGDYPTPEQRKSYSWLLAHAHTTKMPKPHRTDLDLRNAERRGHNDWRGHESNSCPGTHKPMIIDGK